ncbi:G protein-coupled glucose receptor regulating Gpa2-domain-containing protein [Phyllosticta capitalensis]|uniref:G protein-coupled glucose receptor regulating Gpa2-domain-containing protein n=1 Tax=Phyllosticta capitalensis TaxID=121624 RepID=UPI00313295EB
MPTLHHYWDNGPLLPNCDAPAISTVAFQRGCIFSTRRLNLENATELEWQSTKTDVVINADGDSLFLLTDYHKFVVQVVAVTCSCVSLTIALVAFYWFCRMEKRFRHKLIMLLLCGDLNRALWYMIFSLVYFTQGTVSSKTAFAQAAGFFIQLFSEMSDFSVLFIAIHGAISVFKPPVSGVGTDILYRRRHWVYAAIIIIPIISASIPFTTPSSPTYLAQGAFVSLPLRPIWYRLVCSWVPRLLIWIVVISLAFAIYFHVHREFRVFSKVVQDSAGAMSEPLEPQAPEKQDEKYDDLPSPGHREPTDEILVAPEPIPPEPKTPEPVAPETFNAASPFAPGPFAPGPFVPEPPRSKSPPIQFRRGSTVDSIDELTALNVFSSGPIFQSPGGRRNSTVRINPHPVDMDAIEEYERPGSSIRSSRSFNLPLLQDSDAPSRRPSVYSAYTNVSVLPNTARASIASNSVEEQERKRRQSDPIDARILQKRKEITRQLRNIFIYPIAYILMWIIPFCLHCFQYTPKYARNPPFVLTLLSGLCLCIMGGVNSLVFCWREKPWRHIPGSSGTLVASFLFWRTYTAEDLLAARSRHSSGNGSSRWKCQFCLVRVPTGGDHAHLHRPSDAESRPVTVMSGAHVCDPDGNAPRSPGSRISSPAPTLNPPRSGRPSMAMLGPRRARSSLSDREKQARSQAYERLAREQADRAAANRMSAASHDGLGPLMPVVSGTGPGFLGAAGRRASSASLMGAGMGDGGREWWDRRESVWSVDWRDGFAAGSGRPPVDRDRDLEKGSDGERKLSGESEETG